MLFIADSFYLALILIAANQVRHWHTKKVVNKEAIGLECWMTDLTWLFLFQKLMIYNHHFTNSFCQKKFDWIGFVHFHLKNSFLGYFGFFRLVFTLVNAGCFCKHIVCRLCSLLTNLLFTSILTQLFRSMQVSTQ